MDAQPILFSHVSPPFVFEGLARQRVQKGAELAINLRSFAYRKYVLLLLNFGIREARGL